MAQLTVGQDIFAVLIAASLTSAFLVVSTHSYNAHQRWDIAQDESFRVFTVSDYLTNKLLSEKNGGIYPGVISKSAFKENLPKFGERLSQEGFGLRVEITPAGQGLALEYGSNPEWPAHSVSLPVIYDSGYGEKPARMVVWIWRN